jgi:hypothetical protein
VYDTLPDTTLAPSQTASAASDFTEKNSPTPLPAVTPLPIATPDLTEKNSPTPVPTVTPLPIATLDVTETNRATPLPTEALFPLATPAVTETNSATPMPTVTPLPLMKNFKIISREKSLRLQWDNVLTADNFIIYRKKGNKTSWKKVGVSQKTSYQDKKVSPGTKYQYKISAVADGNVLAVSTVKSGTAWGLRQPNVDVSCKKTSQGIKYLYIYMKSYDGSRVQIEVKKKGERYQKLRLSTNSVRRKRDFKIQYQGNKRTIWLRVRTIGKKKGKICRSPYSKAVKIRLK